MDFIATDIFSPPAKSSVAGNLPSVRTASPPSSSGIRKHFSAVLQRVRGEEGRGDRREADDIQSSNSSQNKPQVNEARGRDGSSVRTDRADSPSSKTPKSDRSDEDMNQSDQASRKDVTRKDEVREDDKRSTVEDDARSDSHSAETQPVALTPVPITTHTINQEQIPAEEDPRSSKDEHRATTASSMSAQTSPTSPMPSMMDPETHNDASSSDGAATQSKDQSKQTSAMPAHPMEGNAQGGLILKGDRQAVVDGVDTKTDVADAEAHAAASGHETGRSRPQSDGLARRESNLHSTPAPNDGRIDLPMNDSARIAEGVTLARPASSHSQGHAPSRDNKDNGESKTEAVLPFEDPAQPFSDDGSGESKVNAALLRSHPSSFDVMKYFSELTAGQNSSRHDHIETELQQAAVVEHQVSNGQSTEPIMSGVHGGVGSSSPPAPLPSTPFVNHAQSAMTLHDPTEKSVQMMARSVVFDVAQPDLGHVNIRVAMTNDMVHTHLSADRPEVGQFLINGQDRLQAAFQANGLDMGQFRVDIDRQSAGRSFQQGQFQEQGQAWNQGAHGMEHEHGHRDRQDEPRVSLHGLLNLVA